MHNDDEMHVIWHEAVRENLTTLVNCRTQKLQQDDVNDG
jgi:hypothetical protein